MAKGSARITDAPLLGGAIKPLLSGLKTLQARGPRGFDLTGLFWTKLCEKMSLERSFEKRFSAEQIVVLLRQIEVLMSAGQGGAGGMQGSWDFAAELLSLAEGIWRA
jgi:hypothetical protein